MKELLVKYKGFIFYAIFGVLTTLINIASYALCYKYLEISNVLSNIIAWVLAVAFAFITNKLFVFDSKDMKAKTVIDEFVKFILARLATGVVDILIMFVAVDVLLGPPVIFKVVSNAIVIVLNYVLSRLIVFKK